ncbi:hypothetical protein LC593_29585 [Nostoc sp. CHAB 5844]|nr:hypothetical protein [Nostoc sp. CHAB 5844]
MQRLYRFYVHQIFRELVSIPTVKLPLQLFYQLKYSLKISEFGVGLRRDIDLPCCYQYLLCACTQPTR